MLFYRQSCTESAVSERGKGTDFGKGVSCLSVAWSERDHCLDDSCTGNDIVPKH